MRIEKHIDYSIIIPHKNIPQLLKRCLDSIPFRGDTEIIVVDDNSSPELVDFQQFPGRDRADVRIIYDKRGGGGGYARNLGLKYVRGKWVLFADADDFYNYCINSILDEYKDSDAEVIYFNANSVDTYTYSASHRADHVNSFFKTFENNQERGQLLFRFKFGEPWGKMIKYRLISEKHLLFDETPIHNDTTFSYLIGFYAGNNILFDDRCLYCITTRSGSVSRSISKDKLLIRIQVFGKEYVFLKNKGVRVRIDEHFREMLAFLLHADCGGFIKGFRCLRHIGLRRKDIIAGILGTFFYRIIRKFFSIRFYFKASHC